MQKSNYQTASYYDCVWSTLDNRAFAHIDGDTTKNAFDDQKIEHQRQTQL